jgi:hypothetical protein
MGIKRGKFTISEIYLLTIKKSDVKKNLIFSTTESIDFNISSQESPVNACPDFVSFI